MEAADALQLARLVAYAGLIGGTIEYVEIVKRRAARRRALKDAVLAQEAGLRGLVRIFLSDEERAAAARRSPGGAA